MRKLPNLNQLRVFEAAARHQSFKDAAKELCVTQAAVSHQIKALETDLDQQLFYRLTREVKLTAAGARLAPVIKRALDEMETATTELRAMRMTGTLRISAAPIYTNRIILPRLKQFHDLHPELTIHLEFDDRVVDFQANNIDAGLRYGAGNWPGLTEIQLHGDAIGPICTRSYVEGLDLPVEPARIASMMLGHVQGYESDWIDWFQAAGLDEIPPLNSIEYHNRARMLDLAMSGNGVALADTRLTQSDEEQGLLLRIHPLTIPRNRGMYLVFPERAQPDPRIIAFADWIRTEIAGQDGQIQG